MATWHFDADTVATDDVDYWREQIEALNQRFLPTSGQEQVQPVPQTPSAGNEVANGLAILAASGHQICCVEDWFQCAPPKMGSHHWKDGRSAKELAKAFCAPDGPAVPTELSKLLASSDQLGTVQLTQAWPEHKIRLDSFFGETRNADLAAVGTGNAGVVAVTIEAKADEEFGPTIAKRLHAKGAGINVSRRIASLSHSVFGALPPNLNDFRYQLLHGIAGTLIYAQEQRAVAAVFIVFEFHGPSCSDHNLERNAADLNAFVSGLSPSADPLKAGQIVGPFSVPGGGRVPSDIPLFIGKAVRLIS